MLKLSTDEIIEKIKNEEVFSAQAEDGSFSISIEDYVPYVCAAIHQGTQLRTELRSKIALSDFAKWQEEDPHTEDFILPLPIRIVGLDSRYEYDLNRKPDECIYDIAWEKKVWQIPLDADEKAVSLHKHSEFYRVVETLIETLERVFGACIVYDIHSYNYKRVKDCEPPLFNIGSKEINEKKFGSYVKSWKEELSKIEISNTVNNTTINKLFYGKGYFLGFISSKFKNTLVLATEVKKVYVDETTGDTFPEVINEIRLGLKNAIITHASDCLDRFAKTKSQGKHDLLSSELDEITKSIDYSIFKLVQGLGFLEFVNPTNIESEKRAFFSSNFRKAPVFRYRPMNIDVSNLKRQLYTLRVQDIPDPTFQKMYQDIIDGQVEQLEMLSLRGCKKFLYSSLKYFGEPEEIDIANAKFILHCQDYKLNDWGDEPLTAKEVVKEVQEAVKHYGFQCQVELSKRIPSRALFSPAKSSLKIKHGEVFSKLSAKALAHHEIGVHMLTTANALKQPLKVLRIGLPVYTLTHEGLAILSEYLSGTLDIGRIKMLAYRVLAVEHMVRVQDFKETFFFLFEECKLSQDQAFYLTVRVYRSGGFTKDYLYLRGFRLIMDYYKSGKPLSSLLIGKTALSHLPVIEELVNRGILKPPEYITDSFKNPVTPDPITSYIVSCLK